MKNKEDLLIRPTLRGLVLALAVTALSSQVVHATPYASSITNLGSGTIQFYLNEGGGNVTIKFEDGSTNANYNGITTGTNLASGAYTFSLGAHTSYTISVYKLGAGVPTLINSSIGFTPRGVDVNKNTTSPYFGRVYASSETTHAIYAMNPDLSLAYSNAQTAGVSWYTGDNDSPYRLFVAADDFLMVGDCSATGGATGSAQNDGVWRIDPNLTTNQLFLGPRGSANGLAAGVFGTIQSRPLLIGNPQTGPVTLMQVDGDFPAANGANSLLVYTNITLAALPWEQVPDIEGPEIGLNLPSATLGGNSYPGLQLGPNGYIYSGTYRENYSNPLLQIYSYDPVAGTITELWNSLYAPGTADYFHLTVGGLSHGTVDIGVSPDGQYVAALAIDNWFVIAPLTNGIPDVTRIYNNIPTSYTGNGRGIAFDAADNVYVSSSGLGLVQSWSLGITSTADTTGNASGSTGFSVVFPSTQVSVVASTPNASQGGSNGTVGTPMPGVFTITRTNANNDYSSPATINFSLTGTATNGVYTVQAGLTPAAKNSVVLPAGVASTNIIITPTTANVPRLETTVVLSLLGGSSYAAAQPSSDTVYIQNTSANELVLTPAAATMYKAFSNDLASVTLTRLGDTNAPAYTVPASAFSYSGTAVKGTDFTPLAGVTFNPSDLTQTASVSPLANGVPPSDTINPTYAGDKTITITLAAGNGYTVGANSTTLTLLDNAYPLAAVLFTDPLTDPSDATHWHITYGTGDELDQPANYNVQFGYDLTANNPDSANNGLIGLPPSGATSALRINCNQNFGTTYGGGVNVYYTNQAFGGNYAVRFNMNLVNGDGSYTVEGVMFGINHNGMETNWWLGSGTTINNSGPWASDGVWYWIQAPPGGYGGFGYNEFEEYTGATKLPNTGWQELASTTASTYQNVFKGNLFTALGTISGGTPANNSPESATPADNTWSDVEIRQVKNVVTMSIDHTAIFVYTNTLPFTNGYLMLGYDAPIAGAFNQYVNTPDAAAYFSNLRVVSLGAPAITSIKVSSGNVVIPFTSQDPEDTTASFALQSSSTVNGTYADVNPAASFTQLGTGAFQVTYPQNGSARFYRIRYLGLVGQ